MRALVLINAGARRGQDSATAAVEQLRSLGVDVVQTATGHLDDWPQLIETCANRVDCVVIGGGDGTLGYLVSSLLHHDLTLGILPLGTANDFARTLDYPAGLVQACRTVAEGVDHRVDVGQVNDVYFLNVASIGLAERARRYRSDKAKRWFGSLGYASNLYAAFRDTRPFHARVTCDGKEQALHSIQIAIGNGRYFGGGIAIAEKATIDDGMLDLISLEPQSVGEMIRMLPALLRGPAHSDQRVQLLKGKRMRIETRHRRSINTDGEVRTHTPAEFRVHPKALTVRVPQAYRQAFVARTTAADSND